MTLECRFRTATENISRYYRRPSVMMTYFHWDQTQDLLWSTKGVKVHLEPDSPCIINRHLMVRGFGYCFLDWITYFSESTRKISRYFCRDLSMCRNYVVSTYTDNLLVWYTMDIIGRQFIVFEISVIIPVVKYDHTNMYLLFLWFQTAAPMPSWMHRCPEVYYRPTTRMIILIMPRAAGR